MAFNIDKTELSKAVTQWFFMTVLTGRYTSSPETKMEGDLAKFREMKTGDEFLFELRRTCDEQLTDDFWMINLPAQLANSSANNKAMMTYFASLSILNAKALYSDRLVSDLLDPSLKAPRSALERHHIFPKAYPKKSGLNQYQYNQTANFAVLEYTTNSAISDSSPAVYAKEFEAKFSKEDIVAMYRWHALPDDWQNMQYDEFLQRRRELMAAVIRQGYHELRPDSPMKPISHSVSFEDVEDGEGEHKEFKSTLRKNLHTNQSDPKMEMAVLKTIAGFLNGNGGTLYVGIDDNGDPVGLELDDFPNEDKLLLHVTNLINARLGKAHNLYVNIHIEDYMDKRVLIVRCQPARSAVWTKDNNVQKFFVRTGASTSELQGADAQTYIEKRFR